MGEQKHPVYAGPFNFPTRWVASEPVYMSRVSGGAMEIWKLPSGFKSTWAETLLAGEVVASYSAVDFREFCVSGDKVFALETTGSGTNQVTKIINQDGAVFAQYGMPFRAKNVTASKYHVFVWVEETIVGDPQSTAVGYVYVYGIDGTGGGGVFNVGAANTFYRHGYFDYAYNHLYMGCNEVLSVDSAYARIMNATTGAVTWNTSGLNGGLIKGFASRHVHGFSYNWIENRFAVYDLRKGPLIFTSIAMSYGEYRLRGLAGCNRNVYASFSQGDVRFVDVYAQRVDDEGNRTLELVHKIASGSEEPGQFSHSLQIDRSRITPKPPEP